MDLLLNRFVSNNEKINNKKIERRKPNWTECENVFLLDQFSLHRDILTCKATDASTNLKKQEIWRLICQNLNKHNTLVRRTPAEVRRKWKNLVTAAKKEVWEIRHQVHVNGVNKKISELSQRVLQLHSNIDWKLNGGSGGGGLPHQLSNDGYEHSQFTPIITLSESPPSPSSTSDDCYSNNNYYYEGIDLRVNRATTEERMNTSESTEVMDTRKPPSDAELMRTKLELQIDVLRLRKRKLVTELRSRNRFRSYVRRFRRSL
ncbi:unnamed protein product [Allacma fusca]|uniref:Regulatory protein zeste n=1 Tax=Allacma fusca TaxID=39272 RepID=A0A8J2NQW7_9HEXA|nr:unnamed protein product [Allacma fusca]